MVEVHVSEAFLDLYSRNDTDGTRNGSGFNNSDNGTQIKGDEINSFYFFKTEQFTILWILFVMIVLGNSAVLLTLTLNKSRKSRMNFFIKQLAIADLMVGLLQVLTDIIWRMTIAWYAGNVACKFIRYLQVTVTYSSTYVLVALSIDRYDAITHPMNFSGSWRRARMLVVTAWLLSFAFSSPVLFLFEERPIEGQIQCWIELQPWQWKLYMTLISVALLVIPAIIISSCYTVIVWTIWTKSKLLIPVSHPPRRHSSEQRALRYHEDHDTRRASSRGIIPKAKIKTVKMTFVIVFVFILCWSPYIVFDLLQVYGYVPRTQTNTAIATLIQSLAPLNSAANPIIYCLFSTHMCRTLRRVARGGRWRESSRGGSHGGGAGGGAGGARSLSQRTLTTTCLTIHANPNNNHQLLRTTSRRSASATSLRHTVRLQGGLALQNSGAVNNHLHHVGERRPAAGAATAAKVAVSLV